MEINTVTVADPKTAAKKMADNAVHSTLQFTAYSLGAGALGFDPDQLTLRLDVLTKTKNPELTKYETRRTKEERERFHVLVHGVELRMLLIPVQGKETAPNRHKENLPMFSEGSILIRFNSQHRKNSLTSFSFGSPGGILV